jgi:hypothetical protein
MDKKLTFILFMVFLLFIVLSGWALINTWTRKTAPEFGDTFLFVSTALSGIMVSAFAANFDIEVTNFRDDDLKIFERVSSRFLQFFNTLTPSNITENYYVWGQIIIGTLCIFTWIIRPNASPTLIKNIASLTLSMFVSVASESIKPK